MWFILSILSALSWSLTDVFGKKLSTDYKILPILTYRYLFSIPFLAIYFIFIEIPHINPKFWTTIIVLLPLELTASILYLKAIVISPISLVTPFIAFTPIFLLLSSFIILGEKVSLQGAIGVILITTGAYKMNSSSKDLLLPFKKIFQKKGILLMLIVALIYSITSNLGKLAIRYSSASFMGVFYTSLLGIVFTMLVLIKGERLTPKRMNFSLSAIGFFNAIMMITHLVAIQYIQVAYMIAVKRSSMLFSVVFGYLIFKETGIRNRLFSALLMMIGVLLILLT